MHKIYIYCILAGRVISSAAAWHQSELLCIIMRFFFVCACWYVLLKYIFSFFKLILIIFIQLAESFREQQLARLEGTVRNFCQQIFVSWQSSIQLLGQNDTDALVLIQKNTRILKRVSLVLKDGMLIKWLRFMKYKFMRLAVGAQYWLCFLLLNSGPYDKLRRALNDCATTMDATLKGFRRTTTSEGEESLYDLLQLLETATSHSLASGSVI